MHFQLRMLEIGRKLIFRDKENTNKLAKTFFDIKAVTQRWQLHFSTVSSIKEGTMYVFSV